MQHNNDVEKELERELLRELEKYNCSCRDLLELANCVISLLYEVCAVATWSRIGIICRLNVVTSHKQAAGGV